MKKIQKGYSQNRPHLSLVLDFNLRNLETEVILVTRRNNSAGGIIFSGNKAKFYVLPRALSFIFTGVIRIQTILERFFWHNIFALKTAVKLSFWQISSPKSQKIVFVLLHMSQIVLDVLKRPIMPNVSIWSKEYNASVNVNVRYVDPQRSQPMIFKKGKPSFLCSVTLSPHWFIQYRVV